MPKLYCHFCTKNMLQIALLLFSVTALSSGQRMVCPMNDQSFLSSNRDLLPLENLHSNSVSSFSSVENFITLNNAWCSEDVQTNPASIAGHYVELEFTEPVLINMLQSGGFSSAYVNNFTVQYTMSEEGGQEVFSTYRVSQNSEDFIVHTIELADMFFVLEEAVEARRLRFVVGDAMLDGLGRICWKMFVLGCAASEAQVVPTVPAFTTTTSEMETSSDDDSIVSTLGGDSTRTTTAPSSIDCTSAPAGGGAATSSGAQKDLLLIVIPTALVVLILVLIIVASGVLICICCLKPVQQERDPTYDTVKVKMINGRTRELVEMNGVQTPSSVGYYDNPRMLCYDVPRSSVRSRQGSESLSTLDVEVKNPVYTTKKNLEDNLYHVPPEDDINDYEIIPDSPTATELDKRTLSNTHQNVRRSRENSSSSAFSHPPPPRRMVAMSSEPEMSSFVDEKAALERALTFTNSSGSAEIKYSKVNKFRKREEVATSSPHQEEKDEEEKGERGEEEEEEGSLSPGIQKKPFMSSNDVLALEIDSLAKELEDSRVIVKQW